MSGAAQSENAGSAALVDGLVTASGRRRYAVRLDDGEALDCVLKGRRMVLACGDRVRVSRVAGDGVIEATEIANASAALKKLDKNGDGVVTEEEFFAPHEQRFDAMDANHDGRLTLKEFQSGSIFSRPPQPAK